MIHNYTQPHSLEWCLLSFSTAFFLLTRSTWDRKSCLALWGDSIGRADISAPTLRPNLGQKVS